jgi:nicotinamidase-related amidase
MTIDRSDSALLVIDFQAKLMPAIHDGEAVVARAKFLAEAARLLDLPTIVTEENPAGLGGTVPELQPYAPPVAKRHFDGCRDPAFIARLPAERRTLVVAGCEAHVCVLQTVLGLLSRGRKVLVAEDAVGSRRPSDKAAALARMTRRGAEIVTTEMVAFEWLGSCDDPAFRRVLALVKQL